jgi:hypothetical protein
MLLLAGRHHVARDVLGDTQQAVEADAAVDGISPRWAWAGFWFPLAGLLALGLVYGAHRQWFYILQQEDYPIEWAQFGLCLFSSLVFALAAVRSARAGHRGLAVLLLLTAMGSVALAGEEISWGQRVFGLATPDELAGVNHQSEMNVHNIDVGIPWEALFKLFAFSMGLGGVVLALSARRPAGPLNRTSWWLVAPPLLTVPGFLGMTLYRIFILVVPVFPAVRAQEWIEVGLYSSLAITAACCYTRATIDRYQLDVTGSTPVRRPDPEIRVNSRPLLVIGVAVLLLTLVFAIMTTRTGILPGNI